MDTGGSPPSKRMCTSDPPAPAWELVFEDVTALRGTVEAVSSVMQQVLFRVKRPTPDAPYMLFFDGADPGMSCVVSARLHIDDVRVNHALLEGDEFSFCLASRQLLTAIESSASHGTLKISQADADDARITVEYTFPDQANWDQAVLDTYVHTQDAIEMDDLDMDITLEIQVPNLRQIIKKARKSHAERLTIRVYLSDDGDDETQTRSYTIFEVKGHGQHQHHIPIITKRTDDGSITCMAVDPKEGRRVVRMAFQDCTPNFEGTFMVDKIETFTKILSVPKIKAKLSNGMPLLLTYELGGGIPGVSVNSSSAQAMLRFLLGPVSPED